MSNIFLLLTPVSVSVMSSASRKFAQSLHALKLLHYHGMNDDLLSHVYKAVILSNLLYASPAWSGFISVADKQRLEASRRRAIRLSLYTANYPALSQLAADID